MDTYSILREIADSWVMLFLFAFFIAVVIWAFRPGSRAVHKDTADIPFRHENAPAPLRGENAPAPLRGDTKTAAQEP